MLSKKKCTPCQGGIPPLSLKEIKPFLQNLDGWELIAERKIMKQYIFKTYDKAIQFVNQVARLAEEEAHHPYIEINYKKVNIIIFTHKINGLHENDFILASKCDLIKK